MSSTTDKTTRVRGRVRVEPGGKRIRAFVGGELVADTTQPLLVWEKPYYPTYYIPETDVRTELLSPDGTVAHSPSRGDGHLFTVRAGGKDVVGAALRYEHSPFEELRGAIRLDWSAMDAWFEEDEQVFVHPRDPYTRVDALRSNRRVRVELDGVVLADSASPVMVFETGLPVRYYVNRTDVRFEHLVPSDTVTSCPYKGMTSGYWSVRVGGSVHEDLAWAYDFPTRQLLPIAGLVAFYNEMVDTFLDGEPLDRPQTHFSRTGRDGS